MILIFVASFIYIAAVTELAMDGLSLSDEAQCKTNETYLDCK